MKPIFDKHEPVNLKNKMEKSDLTYKLELLNKANKADIRMQNTVKQRFRAKYGFLADFRRIQAGDVRMYQTHNPGFCYHRDGQPREYDIIPAAEQGPDYQEILNFFFTNGELDIRKVLCLHALSCHPCEALKPPSRHRRRSSLDKSTLERLIDRSRLKCGTPTINSFLPIFILNVNQNKSKQSRGYNQKRFSNECCIRDGRLATRFVINDNISQMVHAALEALQRSNPGKLSYLTRVAQNPQRVKEIVISPDFQPFIQKLNDYGQLFSSNSYYLTRPFMNAEHIKIENPPHYLVKLVNKIRSVVLRNNFKPGISELSKTSDFKEQEFDENKENMNTETESGSILHRRRLTGFDAQKMSVLLYNKIREAQERDMKELKKTLARNSSNAISDNEPEEQQHQPEPSTLPSTSVYERLHSAASATVSPKKSGRIPCSACEEKYMKDILPSKRLTEKSSTRRTLNQDAFKALITKSTQWLNFRINEEADRIHEERMAERKEWMRKKYCKEVPTKKNMTLGNESRRSSYLLRKAKNYAQYYGYKAGESSHVVNNLNLAKIKHEISVKENSKRVKKFLEEPLFQKRISKADDKTLIL